MKDENWKTDLAFLLDVLERVNNLNVILQGKTPLYTSYIRRYMLSEQLYFVLKTSSEK
jgi:hypothetical protein